MTNTERIIYQVYFYDNKWNIYNQNSTDIIKSFDNKEDAINYAVSIARRKKANIDIFSKDYKLESLLFFPYYCGKTQEELDFSYLIIKDFNEEIRIYDDTRTLNFKKAFILDSNLVYLYEHAYYPPEGDYFFVKCSCLGTLCAVFSNIEDAANEYAKLKYQGEKVL